MEEFKRKGDFNKVAELQYGKLPELEKRLKDAQDKETPRKGGGSQTGCCAPRWVRRKLPRWWPVPPAFLCPS